MLASISFSLRLRYRRRSVETWSFRLLPVCSLSAKVPVFFPERFLYISVHIFCLTSGNYLRIPSILVKYAMQPFFYGKSFLSRKHAARSSARALCDASLDIGFQ